MKIDINNYEEYFLLYIDNELSKQEKTEVEIFIRENEGFRREFEMLKKTVCIPEGGISLANKSFLFRKEAAFINDQNYEEIFVLYHDKELTEGHRLETDRFLLSHPELAAEFKLMEKVKLVPESDLVFADKKSLYRKENHGRVIPIIYRFLAAAVFIGFGFWFFINQGNQQVLSDQIVARMSQNDTPTKSIIRKEADPLNDSGLQSEELASTGKSKKKGNVSIKKNYVKPGNKTEIAAITPKEKAEKISKKVSTDFIEQKAAQIVRTGTLKEPIEILKPVPAINAKEESSTLAVNEETIKAIAVNENNASAISYINPESTNENYIFYNIPAEKFKKSKVGAFLKKIKRVVDRNDPLKLIFSGEEKQVVKN